MDETELETENVEETAVPPKRTSEEILEDMLRYTPERLRNDILDELNGVKQRGPTRYEQFLANIDNPRRAYNKAWGDETAGYIKGSQDIQSRYLQNLREQKAKQIARSRYNSDINRFSEKTSNKNIPSVTPTSGAMTVDGPSKEKPKAPELTGNFLVDLINGFKRDLNRGKTYVTDKVSDKINEAVGDGTFDKIHEIAEAGIPIAMALFMDKFFPGQKEEKDQLDKKKKKTNNVKEDDELGFDKKKKRPKDNDTEEEEEE